MSFNEIDISVLVRLDENGNVISCKGGTLTGESEVKPMPEPVPELKPSPEPEPKPKLVVWRRCVPAEHSLWIESGTIPFGWVALEANTQPVETIKQLPEGQQP